MGLRVTFVDISDLDEVERAFTSGTKLLYLEGMANPTLVVADIPKLAEMAHRHGAKLVVDNTFTPLILSPAQLGADVVVHSLTKFINGASDIIGGAVCGSEEFITSLMDVTHGTLMLLGPTMDPQAAFDVSLRVPHLGIRVAEHSRRAQIFAERLSERGVRVVYPGLPGHPSHALLARLANPGYGFGGLLGMDLGTKERAYRFLETLQNEDRFGFIAVSLGYFETLMSVSASSTSSELTEEEQREAGISPGFVRLSVGYTGTVEQRWHQLEDALRILEEPAAVR
jgi:methionine-gamma-lyase